MALLRRDFRSQQEFLGQVEQCNQSLNSGPALQAVHKMAPLLHSTGKINPGACSQFKPAKFTVTTLLYTLTKALYLSKYCTFYSTKSILQP